MKKIVRILAVCSAVVIGLLGMTACGKAMPYSQYNLSDYIKVGEYKGLKVEPFEVKVTDKEVKAKVAQNLDDAAEPVEMKKGDKISVGDTVNIDYVGKMDGKAFEGGTAQGYDLEIGSGTFIKGFEEGLVGREIGTKNVDLKLSFPDQYQNAELAGKDAVFSIKINGGTHYVTPEYNDEFAQSQGDYKNIKEYEEGVKQDIYEEKETAKIDEQKTALWDQVVQTSEVKKYPEEELNNYMDFNSKQIDDYAKEAGCSRDEMLSQYGFASEEDFQNTNKDSTEVRVKQEMIILSIADKEELKYTDDEMNEMVSRFESQGYDEEAILQATGRTAEEYFHIQLLYEKVLDFIVDNASVEK